MSKHTPGPWATGITRKQRVDPRIGPMFETPIHVGNFSNRGNVLAVAYMGGNGALASDEESVEANARLIAAAPELLEALIVARNKLRSLTFEDDSTTYALERIYAAIAKATGEQA